MVGDLFESMLSVRVVLRTAVLSLPGHGGILDRIDGVMPALPVFWVLLIQSKVF